MQEIGLAGGLPKIAEEGRAWRDAGLIVPFDQSSLYDEVYANILARIRRHIEVGEASWDEERKARMRS